MHENEQILSTMPITRPMITTVDNPTVLSLRVTIEMVSDKYRDAFPLEQGADVTQVRVSSNGSDSAVEEA
jgi:hypothetical protein